MKFQFKTQAFQTQAVRAVTDLFRGQQEHSTTFSIIKQAGRLLQKEFALANALYLDEATLQANLRAVQHRNHISQSDTDATYSHHFSIEMETGTGKTYVYIKTIFELHQLYGFAKFIIVVPSVAIREGVYKSLQITKDHFASHYQQPYRYFIYNSAKLSDIHQFARSNHIEIMIINIDAFNKKGENVINQAQDKLNGEKPISYIQQTNPIVIIDEPQSVDNTTNAKEAIASLNPLVVLRYSATHRDKINLIYRLTPVDAYQMGLVKQICIASNTIEHDFNQPYISLKSVEHTPRFSAKIEIDVQNEKLAVKRKIVTITPNTDLYTISGKREQYRGYVVAGINCEVGQECIEFTTMQSLALGQSIGHVHEQLLKKEQIRRTISTHLDKELRLTKQGIKVLSLFFIDTVAKYRLASGEAGEYAKMFEACYQELIELPKYQALKRAFPADVTKVHNGYFSQDKRGGYKDTKGDSLADDDTYNTIMRDKEWLLSFACPLRFIFSHSALKEGWDNPNVFQVCTLLDQKSTLTARQKIGRGLRLCVDQQGNRIEDRQVNLLHVMANESFSTFADTLQKELERDLGIKFGIIEASLFVGQVYHESEVIHQEVSQPKAQQIINTLQQHAIIDQTGVVQVPIETITHLALPHIDRELQLLIKNQLKSQQPLQVASLSQQVYPQTIMMEKTFSQQESQEAVNYLKEQALITKEGKITPTLKQELMAGTLNLSERFSHAQQRMISERIMRIESPPPLRDASKEITVKLKEESLLSAEFTDLWQRIKQKTQYHINFDYEELIQQSINQLCMMPPTKKVQLLWQSTEIRVKAEGVMAQPTGLNATNLETHYELLPDIIRILAKKTLLKRQTIARILQKSNRLNEFLENPQTFIEQALKIITRVRNQLAIEGIRYTKQEGEEHSLSEIFTQEQELKANLDYNAKKIEHSIYDHLIYDSKIEANFATAIDRDPDVPLFFKLPATFKIPTPIGSYNPDWAIYLKQEEAEKLYFIIETKGKRELIELDINERLKIQCGERHFQSLEADVAFIDQPITSWLDFKQNYLPQLK